MENNSSLSLMNILIVEDNPGDLYLIKDLILSTGIGFSITHARKLTEAIRHSNEKEFDVILLDLGLPDSVGLETLQKIQLADIKAPVIIMTGLDDKETALASVKEGAQDYLVKNDLTAESILKTIQYSIERKKIQESQKKNTNRFSILSSASVEISECENAISIFKTVSTCIKRLLIDALVFPVDFNNSKDTLSLNKIWFDAYVKEIQKINGLGTDQIMMYLSGYLRIVADLNPHGKLCDLNDPVYNSFSDKLEYKIFKELEKLINTRITYAIGLSRHENSFGGIIIFSNKAVEKNDKNIIETISGHAALNIHRRNVENDLKQSEKRYKILFKEVDIAKNILEELNDELEYKIQLRTKELENTNSLLKKELEERTKIENKLMESEEKYRLLFNKMVDGFALHEIIVDEKGKPIDYRFISINRAYEELTGLLAKNIVSKTALEVLPESEKPWIEIYSNVALTGKSIEFENFNEGLHKFFKVNAFCPKKGFFAIILEDITLKTLMENEKKIADEQLKKYASDLRDLNATKDKFFGIIAHDLKNPFCSLLGASEILSEYVDKYDIENIKTISRLLNDSAKRGYNLLENLLDWSRTQTGNINFWPQTTNLSELINENIANINILSIHKEIEIIPSIEKDLFVEIDKDMINTVLRNLLNNALKFTNKGGKAYVSAVKNKNEILVSIKDTGTGIPKKDINKLFRIDVQYTSLGTDQEKGTGLGLLLCKEFIEKHGGKIWVESKFGKGSEFKFSIPVSIENQKLINMNLIETQP